MASADFLVYRNTEPNPRPPLVRAFSFGQSLLDLLLWPSAYLWVLDVGMMCYLIRPRSLISSFCSSVPTFAVWLPSVHGSPQTTLPLAKGVTPAHKGLSSSGKKMNTCCLPLKINLYFSNLFKAFNKCALLSHAGHTQKT